MTREYELVHHPFNVQDREETMLFRTDDGFELRFSNDALAKRVRATKSPGSKNYIELVIEDGIVRALGETRTLYEFVTPADFCIPISDEARCFYSELHTMLMGDDAGALAAYGERLTAAFCGEAGHPQMPLGGGFPECPVPLTTAAAHFERFTGEIGPGSETCVRGATIRFGEQIPTEAPAGIRAYVVGKIGERGVVLSQRFLAALFAERPIIRFRDIEAAYSARLTLKEQDILKATYLKKCVALHAFYYSAGPWRHCWVAFGVDPASSRHNYRFQTISLSGIPAPFQIIDHPHIVTEVDRNFDWYVSARCDLVDGFVSKALKCFILFTLNGSQTAEDPNTEHEEY